MNWIVTPSTELGSPDGSFLPMLCGGWLAVGGIVLGCIWSDGLCKDLQIGGCD